MVLRDRAPSSDGRLAERLYVQQDANWNVTALVTPPGATVERFVYDPYGLVAILNPDWTNRTNSQYDWRYLHQGTRYDWASNLYNARSRDFSPSLGRWVNQDPLGFEAGDRNLYRYATNSPLKYTDPSGLAVKTEVDALSILNKEITRWQKNGWNFAAHLLQHFIGKNGPTPYTLTNDDKDEVMKESENMVKNAIYQAIWDNPTITCKNLEGAPIKFKDHVRWNPTGPDESVIGSANEMIAKERVQDSNDALFYAYGGADLQLEGNVTHVALTSTKGGRVYFTFDGEVQVTIADTYNFAPVGPIGSRLWAEAYAAANFLQVKLTPGTYKPFTNTVTFKKVYTGLRSDQINGFAFHTQRGIR